MARRAKGDKAASKGKLGRRGHNHDHEMEPVNGGPVRRITFDEDGDDVEFAEVRETRRDWVPRHRASIDDINFEIDNLDRTRAGLPPGPRTRRADSRYDRTVYSTDRGSRVAETIQPWDGGTRKALYTTTKVRGYNEERRFTSSMVDHLIDGVSLDEEEVIREETTELVPVKRVVADEPVAKPKKAKKPKKVKAKKGDIVVETLEPASDYRPQCTALTSDGKQCRNSSKGGSEFCGSHQGHKLVTMDTALEALDTVPAVEGAEDTAPGATSTKKSDLRPQCAAYTKDGLQCRNSARKSAKYCGSHKGYRAPTKKQLLEMMDTKPRWAKAPDTLPKVR